MDTKTRPLRVLHIIDTLGGGGSERLVWDIIRLSDHSQVRHRVVTIFRDGYLVPFVYAESLRKLGAFGKAQGDTDSERPYTQNVSQSVADQRLPPAQSLAAKLPAQLKKPLAGIWNLAFSIWQKVRRVAEHVRSMIRIPADYYRFRPDIIHTHGFHSFKFGLLIKILFRKPMVHTVPALYSQMKAQGTGWLVSYYRRFHGLVDCFALDPGYCSQVMEFGVPAQKLLEIHGTLDLNAIASVKADSERHRRDVRRKLGIPDDAIVALSVGRLDPTKGHSYALEALPLMLRQCTNLHWLVLGEGADRSGLEKRISELGVEHSAHLIGFDPDPLPYYAAADVYLRTTTMEGENISSRQAIAMGIPTVGFDTGCQTDLIAKLGHGILVKNADAAALAAATCEILSLPNRGSAMGTRAIEYCRTHLGLQNHIDDLLSLYTSLQGKQARAQQQIGDFMVDRKGAPPN